MRSNSVWPKAVDLWWIVFTEELIKIAVLVVLESLETGFHTTSSGKSLGAIREVIGKTLKSGVEWKAGIKPEASTLIKNPNAKSWTSLVKHEHVHRSIMSTSSTGTKSVSEVRIQCKRHEPSMSGQWLVEGSGVMTS